MTQEVYGAYPAIRDACVTSIFNHAATFEPDINAAMRAKGIKADWTSASLAAYTQAVLAGYLHTCKGNRRSRDCTQKRRPSKEIFVAPVRNKIDPKALLRTIEAMKETIPLEYINRRLAD
ncbi:hypothetical protein [Kiloniella majae]|uniref:hypothetical protein n=1 Tax=Kiloniella majae TaxID=1938558 RepID=UPI0018E944E0|nr:hypothetical protein [Kiloniella majae]